MFVIAKKEKIVAHMGFETVFINARILTIYLSQIEF